MLALGEVHTSTLLHSRSASSMLAEQLLALIKGERVQVSERPTAYAVSPDVFIGVDCPIEAASTLRTRVVGTLAARVALTGGRVIQGSVRALIEPSEVDRRLPWSHYLARLGVVQSIGRADFPGIARAHVATDRQHSTMDMGGLCTGLMVQVQQSRHLDRYPPFVAERTVLRWAAQRQPGPGRVRFTVAGDGLRTMWLGLPELDVPEVVALCEDVALHDWLLTVLLSIIQRSRIGNDKPARVVAALRPAVQHLLHLWMPAARLNPGIAQNVSASLQDRTNMTRQWHAHAQWIRDQIAIMSSLEHTIQSRDLIPTRATSRP